MTNNSQKSLEELLNSLEKDLNSKVSEYVSKVGFCEPWERHIKFDIQYDKETSELSIYWYALTEVGIELLNRIGDTKCA